MAYSSNSSSSFKDSLAQEIKLCSQIKKNKLNCLFAYAGCNWVSVNINMYDYYDLHNKLLIVRKKYRIYRKLKKKISILLLKKKKQPTNQNMINELLLIFDEFMIKKSKIENSFLGIKIALSKKIIFEIIANKTAKYKL